MLSSNIAAKDSMESMESMVGWAEAVGIEKLD
jgi:hypothetical protein